MCTRCRGTGEIINAKGKADACPDCARAAEAAWRAKTSYRRAPYELGGKITMHHEVCR